MAVSLRKVRERPCGELGQDEKPVGLTLSNAEPDAVKVRLNTCEALVRLVELRDGVAPNLVPTELDSAVYGWCENAEAAGEEKLNSSLSLSSPITLKHQPP